MAKPRRKARSRNDDWPEDAEFRGVIEMHQLPPDPSVDGRRLSELLHDPSFEEVTELSLRAFRVVAGSRTFCAGFCVGDESGVSPIGIAVVERLSVEAPHAPIHVVPIRHEDIAGDLVLRRLQCFAGSVLLFVFPDSDVYDAGMRPVAASTRIQQFMDGEPCRRLTAAEVREIQAFKAAILDRPVPPALHPIHVAGVVAAPWIFRLVTPAGKELRTAVWDGRRDYLHDFPDDAIRWVGGEKIAIVQIDSPVGVNGRSALAFTHHLAKDFDGVIHWARDTRTFDSIISSFVRLDLDTVGPPQLADDWRPEVLIMPANGP